MEKVRIDKWLWAARFFKTRALAQQAVSGGKVHCNQQRVKPSHSLRCDDELRITQGAHEKTVVVTALSEQRGNAKAAALLYQETAASLQKRTALAEQRRLERDSAPLHQKPTKKQRRQIQQFNKK